MKVHQRDPPLPGPMQPLRGRKPAEQPRRLHRARWCRYPDQMQVSHVTSVSPLRLARRVTRERAASSSDARSALLPCAAPSCEKRASAGILHRRRATEQKPISMVDNMDVQDSAQRDTSPRSQRSARRTHDFLQLSMTMRTAVCCVVPGSTCQTTARSCSPRIRAAVFVYCKDKVRLFRVARLALRASMKPSWFAKNGKNHNLRPRAQPL
jgi:hypothetical protein